MSKRRQIGGRWLLPLMIIALAACETTVPEHLAALRADPLATFELPGADLMESELDDAGFALGDPVAASITHRFSIRDGADPDRVRDAATAKAIESGWTIEDPDDAVVEGTKELATGGAEVSIYFLDETKEVLLVRLEHERPVPQT